MSLGNILTDFRRCHSQDFKSCSSGGKEADSDENTCALHLLCFTLWHNNCGFVKEREQETERLVCVCDNLIVYIWWDLKFRLVSLIMAFFARSLNPSKNLFTFRHTHRNGSESGSVPVKLFHIQTELAVISNPPKNERKTHTTPLETEEKGEIGRGMW